jgi:hypothetical protein
MLDREPLWFPSRNRFDFNPAVSDRQLWATGMVVVQWGMTETIIEQQIQLLIASDPPLDAEYKNLRNFQQTVDFLQTQIELKIQDPRRSQALALITRIRNLSTQRDEVVHRLWGGGMQEGSWSNPENHPTTDAALLRQPGDKPKKTKSDDARATLSWRLSFSGVRKIAIEIGTLNRDLFVVFNPPLAGG